MAALMVVVVAVIVRQAVELPLEQVEALLFVLFGPETLVLSHQLMRGHHELVYPN
jgi:hypothetical protein